MKTMSRFVHQWCIVIAYGAVLTLLGGYTAVWFVGALT